MVEAMEAVSEGKDEKATADVAKASTELFQDITE